MPLGGQGEPTKSGVTCDVISNGMYLCVFKSVSPPGSRIGMFVSLSLSFFFLYNSKKKVTDTLADLM